MQTAPLLTPIQDPVPLLLAALSRTRTQRSMRLPPRPLWQDERTDRQRNRGQDGPDMDAACLLPDLGQLCRVLDLLYFIVHIARASRRQAQSGLLAPLKEADCCAPKAQKQREPPPAIHTTHHECCEADKGESKLDESGVQALPSFTRIDIWDADLANHESSSCQLLSA